MHTYNEHPPLSNPWACRTSHWGISPKQSSKNCS